MSTIASTSINAEAKNAPTSGRLFFLNLSAGRILSANPDGSDLKSILNEGRKLPDGLALDITAGHIYWTNMGDPNRNDGSPCPLNAQDGCQPRGAPDGGF